MMNLLPTRHPTSWRTAFLLAAALLPAALPEPAAAQAAGGNNSGLWWNAAEAGWGMHITQFGDTLFPAWYTYDTNGSPLWFVMLATRQADGSYQGDVLRYTGRAFNQISNSTAAIAASVAGTAKLAFGASGTLTLTSTIGGASQTKQLTRLQAGAEPVCSSTTRSRNTTANFTDIWWNPAESGWGLTLTHHNGEIFAAWFTYNSGQAPVWIVGNASRQGDGTYSGTLTRANSGTPFNQINGSAATTFPLPTIGSFKLAFTAGDQGQFSYTLDGISQQKAISRYSTGNTASVCVGGTAGDPRLGSWMLNSSGQYARVVEQTGGTSKTTWPSAGLANRGGGQTLPVYSDVTRVRYSDGFVYVNGAGLASYTMGPWYLAPGRLFENWPTNLHYTRRIPRQPAPATTKSATNLGAIGLLVNGVSLFNMLDGYYYDATRGADVQGNPQALTTATWVRDAKLFEGGTFDPAGAHQPPSGEYHNHTNAPALRYALHDNVAYNASSNTYSEDTSALHHSPIIGWAFDGYPVYGPYGYGDCGNPAGGVRRMVSGYQLRDGSKGTTNLAATGRTTLPRWAATMKGIGTTLTGTQIGPAVGGNFPLGTYTEDYDYLGDLGYTQGKDFDLDQYNGRTCRTPEYPNGTYAYYLALDASGNGTYPYFLGRQFYGSVTGGTVTSISETVTDYATGGANTSVVLTFSSSGSNAKLAWTSIEGATYKIEATTDGSTYTSVATGVAAAGLRTEYTAPATSASGVAYTNFRVTQTALATYDNR